MQVPALGTTREKILEVALDLFSKQGYEGTSIRDIAEKMEMTKAAVYYHFPAKEALLTDVLGPAMARVGRVLEEHQTVQTFQQRKALVIDLIDVVAGVGPSVVVMLSDPAVGSHIRAMTGGSDLPNRIGRALIGPEHVDPGRASANRIRAACAVAALPAGITAWRQENPDLVALDDDAKDTLVHVVLAILQTDSAVSHDTDDSPEAGGPQ